MHRLRSGLTVLGIILGVSSVIAMLAVGEGASRHVQEQVNRLGSCNIIVKTVKPPEEREVSSGKQNISEYGLTYDDVERFQFRIPNVEVVVPIRRITQQAWYRHNNVAVEVVGTVPWYSEMSPITILSGRFLSSMDTKYRHSMCVIEEAVVDVLFALDNPLTKDIKIGSDYFEIVGIVSRSAFESGVRTIDGNGPETRDQGGANVGCIYIPLTTVRDRYGDISIGSGARGGITGERIELQEIIIRVSDIQDVLPARHILESLLDEFHEKADYQVVVPLELLQEAEHSKRIFSVVLGSIAAISLVVGGIGIMNIMLATVSERTREIGIRRAMGARKLDIVIQFLSETLLLTLLGGLLGICLGLAVPFLVTRFSDMPTVITSSSLILAFGISGIVGITFGLYPAYRAANVDPIESLRHE